MPGWVVHIGVAYIICRLLYLKYPIFDYPNTSLVMIGSILPDVVKLGIIINYFGIDLWDYLLAFHVPLTSLVLAGLFSMLFYQKKVVFGLLTLGICTHYILDLFLIDIDSGIYLFFPLSWQGFHFDIISPDDYYLSIIILFLAIIIFLREWKIKNHTPNQ